MSRPLIAREVVEASLRRLRKKFPLDVAGDQDTRDVALVAEALSRALEPPPDDVRKMLGFLLGRIASWTSARWDQHVRYEIGDGRAEDVFRWLAERCGVEPPPMSAASREDPFKGRGSL